MPVRTVRVDRDQLVAVADGLNEDDAAVRTRLRMCRTFEGGEACPTSLETGASNLLMKGMPGIRDSASCFGRLIPNRRWAKKAIGVILATPVILSAALGTEALVRAKLDPEMFQAPTRLYARRMVLHPGLSLDTTRLDQTL